jgi:hypothetical protein
MRIRTCLIAVVTLLATLLATGAQGATVWELKRDEVLLTTTNQTPGAQRYGFTYCAESSSGAQSLPKSQGWYKLLDEGSTPRWTDKNGNGIKDAGEIEQIPYWLYARLTLTLESGGGLRFDPFRQNDLYSPESRLKDESDGRPEARRTTAFRGLSCDQGFLALAESLEFWTQAEVFCQMQSYAGSLERLSSNERNATAAGFTAFPQLLEKMKALVPTAAQAGEKATAEMVRAWNDWMKTKVASGPDLAGLYAADLRHYWPTREELPPGTLFQQGSGGLFAEDNAFTVKVMGTNLWSEVHMGALNQGIYESPQQPLRDAEKKFAEYCAGEGGMVPLTMPGADEASHKVSGAYRLAFRRANVVAVLFGANTEEDASTSAYVREIAQRILRRMTGGATGLDKLQVAKTLFTELASNDTFNFAWAEHTFVSVLYLKAWDTDTRPAVNETFTLSVSHPDRGRCAEASVVTNAEGKAQVRYMTTGPGPNVITFTNPAGKGSITINAGGVALSAGPVGADGSLTIIAKAIHAKQHPVAGVSITLRVDDAVLPGRGKLAAATAITNQEGVAQFSYTPAPGAAGTVTVTAEAMMGNPPRPVKGVMQLPVPGK